MSGVSNLRRAVIMFFNLNKYLSARRPPFDRRKGKREGEKLVFSYKRKYLSPSLSAVAEKLQRTNGGVEG